MISVIVDSWSWLMVRQGCATVGGDAGCHLCVSQLRSCCTEHWVLFSIGFSGTAPRTPSSPWSGSCPVTISCSWRIFTHCSWYVVQSTSLVKVGNLLIIKIKLVQGTFLGFSTSTSQQNPSISKTLYAVVQNFTTDPCDASGAISCLCADYKGVLRAFHCWVFLNWCNHFSDPSLHVLQLLFSWLLKISPSLVSSSQCSLHCYRSHGCLGHGHDHLQSPGHHALLVWSSNNHSHCFSGKQNIWNNWKEEC